MRLIRLACGTQRLEAVKWAEQEGLQDCGRFLLCLLVCYRTLARHLAFLAFAARMRLHVAAFVISTYATALEPAVRHASLPMGSARRALGAITAAAALVQPSAAFSSPLDDVLRAAATLDALSLSDRACAQKALSSAPFTDASLPTKGGNVPPSEVPFIPGLYYPKSLFAANYERPLPTIGNALRKNMDAAGRELQFAKPKATMDEDVFVKRAKTEAALSMDYLDLLRNEWLDAVQQLESDLDAEGFDAKAASNDLDAARRGAKKWLDAARAPAAPSLGALCATR